MKKSNLFVYSIYALMRDGITFYIGSSKNVELRIYHHKLKFGVDISYKILESGIIGMEYVRQREEFWICDYRANGVELINKNLIGKSLIKLKSIKIYKDVHRKLKRHLVDSEENISEYVSQAIIEKLFNKKS
jgi:hypothetical protein